MKEVKLVFESEDKESIPVLGGDPSNPSWEQYRSSWNDPEIADALKDCIVENGLMGWCGDQIQNANMLFQLPDGKNLGFSYRAWGDLMQAIVNKKEGYMKYYMEGF